MTIKNVHDHYVKSLASLYEKSEAQKISQWVIEDILGINKTQIFLRSGEMVSELKANDLAWKLMRLMKGEPVQYVLGYAYFYGLKIRVNKSVLIPRPETEELVEWIISEEKNRNELSVLDIGTGSGCIAIALKKNLPLAKVYGMDISGKALQVAGENAAVNNTEVSFVDEDILHFRSKLARPTFNIIVSNPPYIPEKEQSLLHKNVLSFEPHEALFVPDDDPLLFYKAIVDIAAQHLEDVGAIYFEVNPDFVIEVSQLLLTAGFLKSEIKKDLSGRSRMVKGTH